MGKIARAALFVATVALSSGCRGGKPVEQKPKEKNSSQPEDVVMLGEEGCHGGGCQDQSTPCKECGADGWCWCSSCCVALKDQSADSKAKTAAAKEKARALAKLKGLSTEKTR
jgi:hypothetical protein